MGKNNNSYLFETFTVDFCHKQQKQTLLGTVKQYQYSFKKHVEQTGPKPKNGKIELSVQCLPLQHFLFHCARLKYVHPNPPCNPLISIQQNNQNGFPPIIIHTYINLYHKQSHLFNAAAPLKCAKNMLVKQAIEKSTLRAVWLCSLQVSSVYPAQLGLKEQNKKQIHK